MRTEAGTAVVRLRAALAKLRIVVAVAAARVPVLARTTLWAAGDAPSRPTAAAPTPAAAAVAVGESDPDACIKSVIPDVRKICILMRSASGLIYVVSKYMMCKQLWHLC